MNCNKTTVIGYLKLIVYLIIITIILVFFYFQRHRLSILTDISGFPLIVLLLIGLLPVYFNALSFKINISIFDVNLKFREWFGLSVINTFYNYIFPVRAGIAVRMGYMKTQYGFPVSSYLGFLTGSYLLVFFTSALTASLVSVYLFFFSKPFKIEFLFASTGVMAGVLIFSFFLIKLKSLPISEKGKIKGFLQRLANSFQFFKFNKNILKYIVLCKFFFILAMTLRLYASYWVLGIEISCIKLLLVSSFVVLSTFVSIVPGNLGIREGIIGLLTNIMGLPLEDAMLGALLDRAVAMILIFTLGVLFHFLLFGHDPSKNIYYSGKMNVQK